MTAHHDLLAKLMHHLGHEPTEGQRQAVEQLAAFALGREPNCCFVLKGYAGTGKTTLISALVKSLPAIHMKSVLLAPTGRAAKVLSAYSARKASTIHKKIYTLKTDSDGVPRTVLRDNTHKNTLFIVDEASMIADTTPGGGIRLWDNNSVLADLISYCYQGDNCRLVFTGDTAQLPPVHTTLSPALDTMHLEKQYYLHTTSIELTDVVRQQTESGILVNATQLRENVSTKDISRLIQELKLETYPDISIIYGTDLEDTLGSAFSKPGMEETLVVCRSNKSANLYNKAIRQKLLWHEEEICAGDFVMVVKNNYYWLKEGSKASFIANGDTVEILSLRNAVSRYGFRFIDASVRLIDYPDMEPFDCKFLLDTLDSESASMSAQQIKNLFHAISEDHADEPRQVMNHEVFTSPWYNALQIKFAYAVTCHKAQGGQWHTVFIDQGYVTPARRDTEYLRWLYTAITRATSRVYLVNFMQ